MSTHREAANKRLTTTEAICMVSAQFFRFAQILLLAAASAAFAAPALAAAGSSTTPAADAFERYASAHPFGHNITNTPQPADAFERYAATHAAAPLTDQRSPDTRDIAERIGDRRSPDTFDAALSIRSPQPATLEPANTYTPSDFDWNDAGLGAVATLLTLAAATGCMLLLIRLHRRQRIQAT
jgi:hypothetical protein